MITFKGVPASTYNLAVKVKKWAMVPASSDTYVYIPGRHGSCHFPGKRQDLLIGLECAFMGSSRDDMYSKTLDIQAWLYSEERDTLSFDFLPGKTFVGKVDGEVDLEPFWILGKFEVTFRCEPFPYGVEEMVSFVADAATASNTGTAETFPVFAAIFTAAAAEWRVTRGSKYIRVVRNFVIGDELEINCLTGSVLVNGIRDLANLDWENSEFFALTAGDNNLVITPAGVCTATVTFSPRWL